MWFHVINLLGRSWGNLVRATSTNTLGFIVWTVAITVMGWTATLAGTWFQLRREKTEHPFERAVRNSLWPGIFEASGILTLVLCGWSAFTVSAVYEDHRSLVKELADFKGFPAQKQQLEDEARTARGDAEHWRSAYLGLSHADIHPDRVMNEQQTNKLFQSLEQVRENIAKDLKNREKTKDYTKIEIGCVMDREACRLSQQLFDTFHEAHWRIRARQKMGKEFDDYNKGYPISIGVTIWSNDQGRAQYLAWLLKDAGVDSTPNPTGPSTFKGLLIWVGYKQWP
jgi:hypothetical protein